MAGNTFGSLLRLTTFGESHGMAIGGIIDGFPSNIPIDFALLESDLRRRKPGQSSLASPRNEDDSIEILSGVFDGKSLGSPIAFLIKNSDTRPQDYELLKDVYRPSHADFSWDKKYGHRDHRGGGRSSARETAARVAAGAFAKMLLKPLGVEVVAWVSSVGPIISQVDFDTLTTQMVDANVVRCPDHQAAALMMEYIENMKAQSDSTGGVISCVLRNVPLGLGEPVFDKLHADLAKAILSINAAKGFEYGSGFGGTLLKGSEQNDVFVVNTQNQLTTKTNYSGGILGGISTGQPIFFRAAFKPVASIAKEQITVDKAGKTVALKIQGRHDPCIVPRAVPIVEAMAALTLADHLLRNRTAQWWL